MATTKTSTSGNGSAYSVDKLNTCKKIIQDTVAKWFPDTLGQVSNIADLHCRLLYQESGINEGLYISFWTPRFIAKTISDSSSVRKVIQRMGVAPGDYNTVTWNTRAAEAALPHGVGQVMGYHFVSEWPEYYCSDFNRVKTNSGGSFAVSGAFAANAINSNFGYQPDGKVGPDALANGIIASLTILNWKYKASKAKDPYDKIRVACQGYLGTGADAYGTTPAAYASFIMDGSTKLGLAKNTTTHNTQIAAGPTTNSATAGVVKPGCANNGTATA